MMLIRCCVRVFAGLSIVALWGGCASPRLSDASTSQSSVSASHDFDERAWREFGMPPADGLWGADEYARAANVLETASARDRDALPREGSSKSGRLFRRIFEIANIDALASADVRDASCGAGLAKLLAATNRISVLYRDAADRGSFQVEIQHSIGFTLHVNRASWEVSDAVTPKSESSAAELAEIRAAIRDKTRENVALFVAALTGSAIRASRAELARAGGRDLGYLVRRLDPASVAAMSSALRVAAATSSDPERADAVKTVLTSLATTPPADLLIAATEIRDAHGTVLVLLPADQTHGVAGAFKRSGPTDLYVTPVATSLASLAQTRPPQMLVIEVVPSTPYRLLVEILFTAGQSEWRGFDLRMKGQPMRHVITYPPRASLHSESPPARLGLTVLVVNDGMSVKGSGGNLATGCEQVGPGLAIPKREGAYDFMELTRCLGKLKATFPKEHSAIVSANPDVAFESILATVEAVRGAHLELFEDVAWGVAR